MTLKKHMRKVLVLGGLLAAAGLGYAAWSQTAGKSEAPRESVSSNFYKAVNQDWLRKTKIPADRSSYGVIDEVDDQVRKTVKVDIQKWLDGSETPRTSDQKALTDFYRKGMDFKQREAEGAAPIKPVLTKIEGLKSLEDWAGQLSDWTLKGISSAVNIGVSLNPKNSQEKQLDFGAPNTILPDPSFYQDAEMKKELLSVYQQSAEKVLSLMGYDTEKAAQLVKGALAFDGQLAQYAMSSEDMTDPEKMTNALPLETVAAYAPQLGLDKAVRELLGEDVSTVNVSNPAYYQALGSLLTEENFSQYKAWLLVQEAMGGAPFLTKELQEAAAQYEAALSGSQEVRSQEDDVYDISTQFFSDTIGRYYGQQHFGQEGKNRVEQMVKTMVASYKERLEKNSWLSAETKAKAIQKLEKLNWFIGYPDRISELIQSLQVDNSRSFLSNLEALIETRNRYEFANYHKPVDRTEWAMPATMVNAYYSPSDNAIVFPAAILQAPFFSADQSAEENYGAIGAIIAHEISHAFDDAGSLYDENGNRANWWTEADRKAFKERSEAMVRQWDGLSYGGGKVNGKLTLGENIADAGGLAVALESLQKEKPKANLKTFFKAYAKAYRSKQTEQDVKLQLTTDSHAPVELRVNQQLKNSDAFYDTFGIKKGDAMYLPPQDRVSVW